MKKMEKLDMNTLAIFGGNETDIPLVPTPTIVSKRIEKIAMDEKITYIEACIHYCEESGVDPEDLSKLINQSLREKIRVEAMAKNFLKKENILPI